MKIKIPNKVKKTYGIEELWESYSQSSDTQLTKAEFKEVIKSLSKSIIEEIVFNAKVFSWGFLGHLYIKKVKRTAKNKLQVKYDTSTKDSNGKFEYMDYYDDPFYLRYYFKKTTRSYIFKHFVKFTPAGGDRYAPTNNKVKIKKAIDNDPTIQFKYLTNYSVSRVRKFKPNGLFVAEYAYKDIDSKKLGNILNAAYSNRIAYGYKWEIDFTIES